MARAKYGSKVEIPEEFKARSGLSVQESIANNATTFMNHIWKKIEQGDKDMTAMMFSALTRESVKKLDTDNPLSGLPELRQMSLEDLLALEEELNDE